MRIYRMRRSVRAAADYAGAMAAGGRWNPIGTPMLYAAQHLSMACLEDLVHLDKSEIPRHYVWSAAELAEAPQLMQFENFDSVTSCQAAGDSWARRFSELAIHVPSVIIPEEFNILLNPKHTGYSGIVWSEPRPFRFDPRLFIAEPQVL
jgi:RES domain-containing protein